MITRHLSLLGWLAMLLLIGTTQGVPVQAGDPTPPSPPTFNEKDLFPYKPKGQGAAVGQVFLGLPSGKAITQAGASVYLIPVVPYTRAWFDRNVRANACLPKVQPAPTEGSSSPVSHTDCIHSVMTQLLAEKRLIPYLRITRANPTGHFWFIKIPAGRYYVVSVLEGNGGSHQEERAVGIAWSTIDLDADEKATNLVVSDCKSALC